MELRPANFSITDRCDDLFGDGLIFPGWCNSDALALSSRISPESGVLAAEASGLEPSLPREYSPVLKPKIVHAIPWDITPHAMFTIFNPINFT